MSTKTNFASESRWERDLAALICKGLGGVSGGRRSLGTGGRYVFSKASAFDSLMISDHSLYEEADHIYYRPHKVTSS
jgi:hypothetical protein